MHTVLLLQLGPWSVLGLFVSLFLIATGTIVCFAFINMIRQLSPLHVCSIDWFTSVYVVPRELLNCVEVY